MAALTLDPGLLPKHVAIIMDGNGRWAKRRRMPRVFGHRAGMKSVRAVIEECAHLKIEVLTLYAFSTENWARPAAEVQALMSLLRRYVRSELEDLNKNNIQLRVIGDISRLPAPARNDLHKALEKTSANNGLIVNLALNYGGRQEMVRAVNRVLKSGKKTIEESDIAGNLDTAGLPDPDMVIRTSGEMRLSNFLLWQSAYAELYITDVLWPDFGKEQLRRAFLEYQQRERRFGGV